MAAEFVHLHVHSQYSFLTSAVKLSDLPGKAKALGMSGLGRKMGFQKSPTLSAGEQLFERYVTVTDSVRSCYLRLLGLPE